MFVAPRRASIVALKLAGLALLAVLALGPVASAGAQTFTVDSTDDTLSDGSCPDPPDVVNDPCTLRDAIDTSNDNTGDDTINVLTPGTYPLDYELYIERNGGSVTIVGASAGTGPGATIIDGQQNDRVIKVRDSTATIKNLTITGGLYYNGGGLKNRDGNTTLDHVSVINNRAGTDTESNFCDTYICQGGGIYNDGKLTVRESVISGNTADGGECGQGQGGGIYNNGLMALTNVTISDNLAADSDCNDPGLGGGIFESSGGFPADATASQEDEPSTVLNATISDNEAGLGGGVAAGGGVNTAPVGGPTGFSLPNLSFKNTIVANNLATFTETEESVKATSGTDNCYPFESGFSTVGPSGHNLESDTSCGFVPDANGNQQNKDPLLGALANNGGQTETMALLTGSPAIDTADNSGCPGTDQRDVTRPQNGAGLGDICDIGAYEVPAPAAPAAAVAAVAVQAKPVAKASIRGPGRCTRSTATVRVSGQNISTVTYSLDGKKIKKAKGNKTSVKVNLRHKKSGVHRVTAKVSFTAATAAKSQTKRFTVSRCARKAAKPKFTG